jgi:hypothetical protein
MDKENNSICKKSELQILNVEYGMNDKYFNVTDKVKKIFLKNNKLFISKETNLNSIFGDPCDGIKKELKIDAVLNNIPIHIYEKEHNYFLNNDVIIHEKNILNANYDTYYNKNLVLVTSKIIVSEKPFSYIKTRSIYTKEERLTQTINTIETIRKHIPDSYIVLVDNSKFSNLDYETLFFLTDYFINITNDTKLNYYTDEEPIKMFSDLMQQLCFYEQFIKKIDENKIRNFFKITGRYFINDKFNYNNYDNDYTIFKKNLEVLDRDYYYTSFYKINSNKILDYFDILKNIEKEKKKYSSTNIPNDFEVILPSKINDKKEITNLGITQVIAVWNQINEI